MAQLLTPGPLDAALALVLAVLADLAYPRHTGILYLVHPVRLSYLAARRLARPYSGVARGVAVWLLVQASILAPAAAALYLAVNAGSLVWILAAAATLKFSAALKLLLDTALRVAYLLERGDLDSARATVGEIVRRDTRGLDEWRIASAAIESVAENLVDGFTSPLTYYALLGPLGALAQRVANTLDGAIGYRTPEYERVGKASALADSAINFAPARLTAALIAVSAPLAGGSLSGALRSWALFRSSTGSVNSGHPIAAMAGALGVRLEKPGSYVVNASGRPPGPGDVRRAVRIACIAAGIHVALTLAAIYAVWVLSADWLG